MAAKLQLTTDANEKITLTSLCADSAIQIPDAA